MPATTPTVIVRDRLDRTRYDASSPARLQVLDDDPDTATPRMWLRSRLGTARDGVWTATLRIPKGARNGTWNVTAAQDRAGSGDVRWLGPDAYRRWVDLGACCSEANPFPDGAGALTVIGADDRPPPGPTR